MISRPTKLSPLLRCFAAGALFVWLAAQALCFAHCNFGVSHGGSTQPSCHASAPSPEHHDNGDESAPSHQNSAGSVVCSTLKSALVGSGSAALVQPDFHLLYTLAPVALMLDMTAAEPTSPSSRQAKARDWVFTPEVCLGPAFRSLAPPSLG
jgi:hypothetical protein